MIFNIPRLIRLPLTVEDRAILKRCPEKLYGHADRQDADYMYAQEDAKNTAHLAKKVFGG